MALGFGPVRPSAKMREAHGAFLYGSNSSECVGRGSGPYCRQGGRDAHPTAAGTAALRKTGDYRLHRRSEMFLGLLSLMSRTLRREQRYSLKCKGDYENLRPTSSRVSRDALALFVDERTTKGAIEPCLFDGDRAAIRELLRQSDACPGQSRLQRCGRHFCGRYFCDLRRGNRRSSAVAGNSECTGRCQGQLYRSTGREPGRGIATGFIQHGISALVGGTRK
jgi:hypothetical protein